MSLRERGFFNMGRGTSTNRFAAAGQALVGAEQAKKNVQKPETPSVKKKDKVVTAKVYPETWAAFTQINQAQGMTNNSAINMLISRYIMENKVLLNKD